MPATARCPTTPLTRHQGAALDFLCQGQSDKQIAHALGISVNTVRHVMVDCKAKLGASNRVHAAMLWRDMREQYAGFWAAQEKRALPPFDLPGISDPPPVPPSAYDIFWSCVDKHVAAPGCWLWTGPHGSRGMGTPVCALRGLRSLGTSARRIAYALATGEALPPDIALFRDRILCHYVNCVRPEHMKKGRSGRLPAWEQWTVGEHA